MKKNKNKFWNERAQDFKKNAGSNDFLLKNLEVKNILKLIKENKTVLDIGCGNGETLLTICESKNCTGKGIDFSSDMISLAKSNKEGSFPTGTVEFEVGNILELNEKEVFDYILTERCLINVETEKEQKNCFDKIIDHLKIGGTYIMVESFKEGLDKINSLRTDLHLEEISVPWHNTFLSTEIVHEWQTPHIQLEDVIHGCCITNFWKLWACKDICLEKN